MPQPVVGIEINPSSVRVAVVTHQKSGPRLDVLAEVPLEEGAVDANGVDNAIAVTNAVHHLLGGFNIKAKHAVLGVGGQRVVVRHTPVTWAPRKELGEILVLDTAEMLPYDPDEAVIDYIVDGEQFNKEGDREYVGTLVAAPEDYVATLVDAVQEAKLEVQRVDLTAFAVLRAIAAPVPMGVNLTEAIVNISALTTQVIVHTNGRPALVRGLPQGAKPIFDALNLLEGADRDGTLDALEPLTTEISSTIRFYQAGEDAQPLSRLIITGEGSMLPGMGYSLSAALNLPVAQDAYWLSLQKGPAVTPEVVMSLGPRMAAAVGLAMEGA